MIGQGVGPGGDFRLWYWKWDFLENNKSRAASNAIAKTTNQEENSIAGIFVAALICEFGSVGGFIF